MCERGVAPRGSDSPTTGGMAGGHRPEFDFHGLEDTILPQSGRSLLLRLFVVAVHRMLAAIMTIIIMPLLRCVFTIKL